MKKSNFYLFILLAIGWAGTLHGQQDPKEEEGDKEEGIEARFKHEFDMMHDPATNTIPRERVLKAQAFAEQLRNDPEKVAIPITWIERGPDNVGGRTRALMYDLNDATGKTVFAGGVGGGLWKTTDITSSTPNWQKVDDFFDNLAICSIVQDASSPLTMYFGTGEGFYNADAIRGLGIWKSTDGGANWTHLAATANSDFDYVNKVIVNDAGHVMAATRTRFAGDGGIFRSTDGGSTWTRVLNSTGFLSAGADIEMAANGDLYASLGIGYNDGIYKSTNDGANWTQVYTAPSNEERIELATAPSNSNVVYALFENGTGGGVPPIRRTTNGGTSWNSLTTPIFNDCGTNKTDWTRGQDWYDLIAGVDPADEDIVYIGGVDLFKTTNGGTSWTQISSWCGPPWVSLPEVHADQHAIAFKPGSSTEILFGNDGGVHRTTNGGSTFSARNDDYNVTQYYACAIHPDSASNYMLAGAQDNGTQKYTGAGMNSTTEATGGDGAFCHIDQDAPNNQITSYVRNNYFTSTNGGTSWTSRSFDNNGRFINPTDYDNDANILYAAHSSGQFLRWEDIVTNGPNQIVSVGSFNGTVSCVTADPNTTNRVWFGLASSFQIVRMDNAHNNTYTVTDLTIPGVPSAAYPSSIAIEDGDADHLLVTISNFGVNSVWESINGGSTWTSVEGNLPDIPVRWGMFNPNDADQAFVATELGVWSTQDLNGGSTDWDPSNMGLANVRVDMLQYRSSDKLVAAATHGRGVFTTDHFNNPGSGGGPTVLLDVDGDGVMNSMSGAGTRMVVADATGQLSTQAIPGGGSDTDEQTLSKSGNTVSLSAGVSGGGGSADLTPYVNNTDNQTLSFNSGTEELSISGGNTISLSTLGNGGGLWSQNGTKIYYNTNYVGIGTNNPLYKLGVYNATTTSGAGIIYGRYTGTGSVDAIGVQGYSRPVDYYGVGVEGEGGYIGVRGEANGTGTGGYYGVSGAANGTGGTKYGVYGYASGGGTNYAGYFNGDVRVISDFYVNDDIFSLDRFIGSTTPFGLYDLNVKDQIGLYNSSNILKMFLEGGPYGFSTTYGSNGSGNNYLTVSGGGSDLGALAVGNSAGTIRAYMQVLSGGEGFMKTSGPNNNTNVFLTSLSGYSSNGYLGVVDDVGTTEAGMYVNSAGDGVYFADVKNFRIEHPEDRSKHIWYACVEGPEVAAYERGTATLVKGEAFIPFSSHFEIVASPSTMTVKLTPLHEDTYGIAVVEKTSKGIYVKEFKGGNGNFQFDWEVQCVRKGYEDYKVVRDASAESPYIEKEPVVLSPSNDVANQSESKRIDPPNELAPHKRDDLLKNKKPRQQ